MPNKKTATTKKTPTSYSISDDHKRLLKLVAENQKRSMANMLEVLISDAAKAHGIK